MKDAYKILVGKPERGNHSGNTSVERRTILKWILKK
jgi:hypothetical protein